MVAIFLQTLPFFALIACGYFAALSRFMSKDAARVLTKFVFYFALSAMLFRLSATLPLEDIWQPNYLLAYLLGCLSVYGLALIISRARGQGLGVSAFEAQSAVIGNIGFIGLPMFVSMFGARAAPPIMMSLVVDLIVFGSLIVVMVEISKGTKSGMAAVGATLRGLVTHPMIMAIVLGLLWSVTGLPWFQPIEDFTRILGSAATPCALFAIGCTLAQASAEARQANAMVLSFAKLVLHPLMVAVFVFGVFDIDPFIAAIAVAGAAMPTAGNIYILAQHYGIAVHRVSATILISTLASVATVTLVLGFLGLENSAP